MQFSYIVLGFFLAILGVGVIFHPIFHDKKHNFIFDFTEVKWPFGVFLTLLGVGFLYFSFRKRPNGSIPGFFICPACRTPYDKKDIHENQCPTCGAGLENLAGFYERHPEFKDK